MTEHEPTPQPARRSQFNTVQMIRNALLRHGIEGALDDHLPEQVAEPPTEPDQTAKSS